MNMAEFVNYLARKLNGVEFVRLTTFDVGQLMAVVLFGPWKYRITVPVGMSQYEVRRMSPDTNLWAKDAHSDWIEGILMGKKRDNDGKLISEDTDDGN